MAGIGRLSTARVSVGDEAVELPWASRSELLERLRSLDGTGNLVRRFEAVGATRPVDLDDASASVLADVLAGWVDEAGPDSLPPGIFDLYDAVAGEGSGAADELP